MIQTRLIDRRNIAAELPIALAAVRASSFLGLDCETEDSRRHAGITQACGYRPDGTKPQNTKLVFDNRRTTMCGFSIYPEGSDVAWYVNLAHADVENRLDFSEVRCLLDEAPGHFVAHNAPFELVMFLNTVGYELPEGRVICTLQQLVSAYGPDEYHPEAWRAAGLGGMRALVGDLIRESRKWVPKEGESRNYPPELADLVYKIIAKESDAAHSYNGFVKEIAYGYGLKKAVKTWFGHQMTTFEEVLNGRAHMGQLTGEEVKDYGAEDAYWAVRLFRNTLDYMARNCPEAIEAYFNQELPMIHVYADIWRDGIRITLDEVEAKRDAERLEYVEILKQMKAAVRQLLPWRDELDPELAEMEPWYAKNGARYRKEIEAWANSPDLDDPYLEAIKIAGAVPNAWWKERNPNGKEPKRLNMGHYMPMRVIYYDLMDEKIIKSEGKVQSDGDARGKLIARMDKAGRSDAAAELVRLMGKLASVEQGMKLYLTPYMLLTDPETLRIYPVASCMLAARRIAISNPNTTQLAKRGATVWVRGFYVGDDEDHLILSLDWSGVELVRIGEESGDPEFIRAFGQLPHKDLHSGAAADILSVELPEMTVEKFLAMKGATEVSQIPFERLLTNLDGQALKPEKVYGYWRTEIGKGANFNFWYSGWLATIGERMGWNMDQTADAVSRYTNRFAVAEEWRRSIVEQGAFEGFTMIADGHRRVRYEARMRFLDEWMNKWPTANDPNLARVVMDMGRRIQKRAGNQLVNARIQNACASIAKRSILRIREFHKKEGIDKRVSRFMWPTHDELTFSVRWDMAADLMAEYRRIMCDHPDLFQKCVLDASASLGVTFEPWGEKAPLGQVELFEAPKLPPCPNGGLLTTAEMKELARYLHDEGQRLRLAA